MIKTTIEEAGICQNVISRKSEHAARIFKEICPELPGRLTTATISRMKTGSGLQKLKRGNLQLLHLTMEYAKNSKQWASTAPFEAVEAAASFAANVLAAGLATDEPRSGFFDPSNPRHDRAACFFGEYGVKLLEYALARDDARSFRKLALLQHLSGNTDDARHWNERAGEAGLAEALDNGNAAEEAFMAGRRYLYSDRRAVAEVYLALAAGAGHAGAACLLSEVRETLQHLE